MQILGVARDNVLGEESDYVEPCHELGGIQVDCTEDNNCFEQFEMSIKTLAGCRKKCQKYQDSKIPCVFFVFNEVLFLLLHN